MSIFVRGVTPEQATLIRQAVEAILQSPVGHERITIDTAVRPRPIQEARRQDAEAYAEHLTAKGAQAAGKPRMDLIPWDAVEAIAQHFGTSAAKYPDHDWEKLDPAYSWSTYFGAMMRHAGRWALGEDYDEKGYSHAAAFATNAMMLLTYVVREHPGDDRPKVLNPGQERRA